MVLPPEADHGEGPCSDKAGCTQGRAAPERVGLSSTSCTTTGGDQPGDDGAPDHATAPASAPCMSPWTLRFYDAALESEYQRVTPSTRPQELNAHIIFLVQVRAVRVRRLLPNRHR